MGVGGRGADTNVAYQWGKIEEEALVGKGWDSGEVEGCC